MRGPDASSGVVTGVSVSHAAASVDEIETAGGDSERATVRDLLARDGVEEAFVLQTCNRAEAYVVTAEDATGRRALSAFAPDVRDGAVVDLDHEGSIRHLMRVAAGLESLVLGEDQILGQFKTAVEEARAVGGIGQTLEEALLKAIHVGERARTETSINEGVVSLGSAAVELASEQLDLEGATALVVGAGEMATLSARALVDAGVDRLVVANRTVPHAEHLADDVDVPASAVGLDAVGAAAAEADLVVSATSSPDYVFGPDSFVGTGETLLVDIAQPRDIDPEAARVEGVEVCDIDSLESVTASTHERRREAAARVESMIEAEFDRLMNAFKRQRADDAISAMYESAERTKREELDTALSRLEAQGDLTADQRETVSALADALVSQLLAAPTKSLREAAAEDDWNTIHTAMQLFDPDFGGTPSTTPTGETPEELPDDADTSNIPDHVLEQFGDD